MAHLKILEHNYERHVFLSLQMLKRHHRLLIEREGRHFLGFVRPISDLPGDLLIVIPDPGWPGAQEGRPTRLRPEEALDFEMRLASEEEVKEAVLPILDTLVP
jgi:hypothetical protein